MQGYIKLYRQLQEHELWKEKRKFSRAEAWIDLLMLANHKPAKIIVRGILISLEAGDLFWSQDELAKKWSWSKTKVNSFLKMLEKEGQISYKVDYRIGITSIVNWAKFQQSDTTDQDTNQTTEKPQKSYKLDSNKNVKNEKNVKNIYTKKYFLEHTQEILEEARSKYGDIKNVDKAMQVFCNQIGAKNYKYTNYKLAFFNWVREDRFNQFNLGAIKPVGTGKMKIDIN